MMWEPIVALVLILMFLAFLAVLPFLVIAAIAYLIGCVTEQESDGEQDERAE